MRPRKGGFDADRNTHATPRVRAPQYRAAYSYHKGPRRSLPGAPDPSHVPLPAMAVAQFCSGDPTGQWNVQRTRSDNLTVLHPRHSNALGLTLTAAVHRFPLSSPTVRRLKRSDSSAQGVVVGMGRRCPTGRSLQNSFHTLGGGGGETVGKPASRRLTTSLTRSAAESWCASP